MRHELATSFPGHRAGSYRHVRPVLVRMGKEVLLPGLPIHRQSIRRGGRDRLVHLASRQSGPVIPIRSIIDKTASCNLDLEMMNSGFKSMNNRTNTDTREVIQKLIRSSRIAVVVFQIISAPRCERLCILGFEVEGSKVECGAADKVTSIIAAKSPSSG